MEIRNWKIEILICFFLTISILSVYLQVVDFDFIDMDDALYIFGNPHVQKGITQENIIWALTAEVAGNWHPLTVFSHMLDCEIYGLNPGLHHLTNLLFHIANTLLLFFVLKRMTGILWPCVFVAAMFALHPLHVESVAWISERKDVLSTFFWMLTMWAYVRYVESPGRKTYIPLLVFFALGLMSKPMLVTLPFVLLLLDYWPLKRYQFEQTPGLDITKKGAFPPGIFFEKIPMFVLSAASCVITFYYQQMGRALVPTEKLSFFSRISNAFVSYTEYLIKMVWPFNLSCFYPHPGTLPVWQVSSAIAFLTLITLFAIKSLRRYPFFTIGWLWYIGTLVPVIGIVQVGGQAIADRYTYIPLIGIFIIVGWGVPALLSNIQHKRILLIVLFLAPVLILLPVTWNQIRYWKNGIFLFQHALHVTEKNYNAHNNLGLALLKSGKTDEASRQFHNVLKICQENFTANHNLGIIFSNQGEIDKAIKYYLTALKMNPSSDNTHTGIAIALSAKGNTDEAIHHLDTALKINPLNSTALSQLGKVFLSQGKIDEAIKHFSDALRINPESAEAHINLGLAFSEKKMLDKAVKHLKAGLEMNPGSSEGLLLLADLLMKQGNYEDAFDYYSKVLKIDPDSAQAHNNSGCLLAMKGNTTKAVYHFNEAIRIAPGDANTYKNFGDITRRQGKIKDAIELYRKALELKPEYSKAEVSLGETHLILGNKLLQKGKVREAVIHFRETLLINKDSDEAHANLGYALHILGRKDEALIHCKEAIRIRPDENINAYYNLACIYAVNNRPEESVKWLKKAVEKGFKNWETLKADKDLVNIRATKYYNELINRIKE